MLRIVIQGFSITVIVGIKIRMSIVPQILLTIGT